MTVPPPPDPAQDQLHGMVRLGAMFAALPIHYIREVVPRPPRLLPFPGTCRQLRGAIALRGAIIPVLDLAAVLGDGTAMEDTAIIMVVRVDDCLFGIGIDEICGVVPLAPAHLTPLRIAGAPASMLRSGFAQGDRQGVVLNVAQIAAMPGLAMAHERAVTSETVAQVGVPTLMFSMGGFHFGLVARVIEASVPVTPAAPSPVDDPMWIGMIEHNGRRVPVVDTLFLLGLGRCEPANRYGGVIVRMPGGALVALRIDSVENILRIQPGDQLPAQGFPVGRPHLLSGLHEADRLSLLIDADALQAEPTLADIACLEEAGEGGTTDPALAATTAPARRPFLIVTVADGNFAIPLEQVDEILPANAKARVDLPAQTNGIVGMIAHRGCAVPLYDLAFHLDPCTTARDAEFILLASVAGRRLGFLLQGLSAVERTRLQPLAAPSGSSSRGVPGDTIRISDGTTCSVLDLAAMIDGLAIAPQVAAA